MPDTTIKVIVAGGRDFHDYDVMHQTLLPIVQAKGLPSQIEIVSGTARGADSLGERFAQVQGCHLKQFPADWDTYGNKAGYRRNAEMADYADVLVAYWDQKSRGTMHMINLAKKKGLEVHIIHY